MRVMGLDVGGANTKAAFIATQNGTIAEFKTVVVYFPFWKHNTKDFCTLLTKLKNMAGDSSKLDALSLTITAELSDAFETKKEGIIHILDCVSKVFTGTIIKILTVEGSLRTIQQAKAEPLSVAAANWVATGWMVSQRLSDCVVVDVGSTSTSIVSILGGKIVAEGKTDLEKLANGELVYTGSLRTNLAAIVQAVPVKGRMTRVSSELFAQSADVHLVLANITEKDYTVDTPDGKGKTRGAALSRLAKVVCADTDMLSEAEIMQIATYIYDKQLEQIANAIKQVHSRLQSRAEKSIPAVVTGMGRNFLARKAAEKADIIKIVDSTDFFPKDAAFASPAAGVALMVASKLEGRNIAWTQ